MSIKSLFEYKPETKYSFTLEPSNDYNQREENQTDSNIYTNIDLNLKFMKNIYNLSINSDIIIRESSLTARNMRI